MQLDRICYSNDQERIVRLPTKRNTRTIACDIASMLDNVTFTSWLTSNEIKLVLNGAISICDHLNNCYKMPIQKETPSKKQKGSKRSYILATCIYWSIKQHISDVIWPELIAKSFDLDIKPLIATILRHPLFDVSFNTVFIIDEYKLFLFVTKNLLKMKIENIYQVWCQVSNYVPYQDLQVPPQYRILYAIQRAEESNKLDPSNLSRALILSTMGFDDKIVTKMLSKIKRRKARRNESEHSTYDRTFWFDQ